MKKEIVKSCTTCGKIQEGNTDGNRYGVDRGTRLDVIERSQYAGSIG